MIPKCYNLPKASQNQPHNSLLFNYFRGFGACHVASTCPGSTSNCHQFGPTWITGMIHDQTNHLQRMFGTENWPKKIGQFLELPFFGGGIVKLSKTTASSLQYELQVTPSSTHDRESASFFCGRG